MTIISLSHNQSMWAERKTERSGRKTAWAGAERSGLNRPLKVRSHQHSVDLAIFKLTYPRFAFSYSISILALIISQSDK